jgi:prolipoprotein diacylglyceryltransferase
MKPVWTILKCYAGGLPVIFGAVIGFMVQGFIFGFQMGREAMQRLPDDERELNRKPQC